jgi:hypothetical protein
MYPGFINFLADHGTTWIHCQHHINIGDGIIVVRGKHEGCLGQVLAPTAKCYKIRLAASQGFNT